jgi:hypothetical protein
MLLYLLQFLFKNISIFGLLVDYSSYGIVTIATYGLANGVGREMVSRAMSKPKEHIIIVKEEDECIIVDI